MESNDSLEIPDRRAISDISGVPSGDGKGTKLSETFIHTQRIPHPTLTREVKII